MMTKIKILSLSKRGNIYTRMLIAMSIIPRSEKWKDLWKKLLYSTVKVSFLQPYNYHCLNMISQPCFISELPIIILHKYFN